MSQQQKFRKIAFDNSDILDILKNIPIDIPSEVPADTSKKTPSENPSKAPSNSSENDKRKNSKEENLQELKDNLKINFFNEDELKELLPYIFGGVYNLRSDSRYSPAAFEKALETNKNIGYKGTSHSQGAYQKTDPKILKQVQKFKKNPPKNLKDLRTDEPTKLENINVPNTSDRYKSMRSNLYRKSEESTEARFIKTSADKNTDISKLLPSWNINDVLNSMKSVADKTNLSPAEKQQSMINVLAEYEKSIAPLSQFLDKNDIKYK